MILAWNMALTVKGNSYTWKVVFVGHFLMMYSMMRLRIISFTTCCKISSEWVFRERTNACTSKSHSISVQIQYKQVKNFAATMLVYLNWAVVVTFTWFTYLLGYLMELSTVEGKTQEEASLFRGVLTRTSFNQNKQTKAWLRDWKDISACQVTFAVPWYYCEVMR